RHERDDARPGQRGRLDRRRHPCGGAQERTRDHLRHRHHEITTPHRTERCRPSRRRCDSHRFADTSSVQTGRAILFGTLWIALISCESTPNGLPARNKCGGPGNVAGLPPPSAVWTLASASSNFYTPRVADLEDDGNLEVVLAGGNEMPSFGEV